VNHAYQLYSYKLSFKKKKVLKYFHCVFLEVFCFPEKIEKQKIKSLILIK